jgi:dipeptidyl-peptidase 4
MTRLALALLLAAAGLAQQTSNPVPEPPPLPAVPSPVWAPGGKRFVYVEKGSLWLYDLAGNARKELTALSALDARAVSAPEEGADWRNRRVRSDAVQWSPTGSELLISARGDLFLFHLRDGSCDQLTATPEEEAEPRMSPDGLWVSFRRSHDLYALQIASRALRRLTTDGSAQLLNAEADWVYPEELRLSTAHWWSPDSTRIAFLQFDVSREPLYPQVSLLEPKARPEPQLYPQPGMPNADVRLGVVTLAGERRWIDLGDPRDQLLARVYWSPDGATLAAIRQNRLQSQLDLLFVGLHTGAVRTALHEQDACWVNLYDDFRFLGGGRFLWGSDRDGFHHLYLYGSDGKATQLTKGQWEVSAVAGVDEASNQVFYVSNEGNPLERHLYRVGFDGKHKQRLTTARGTHDVSMSPAADYYADTFSAANQPPGMTLHDRTGEQQAVFAKPAAAPAGYLPTEFLTFKASDGETFYARMVKPEGFTQERKYPVVVMVYGGPHAQSVADSWRYVQLEQFLAHRGFLVWQMDNRGTAGRGKAWETRVFRNLGALELEDQLAGIRYLQRLPYADTARAGIYGWSYGGFMTLYALTHSPETFRAGAAGAPVTDWRNYDTIYTERYLGLPAEEPDAYRKTAPVNFAANLKANLLLMHNFEDDNVHFQNTLQMIAALEKAGKRFQLALYPQRTHGVTGDLQKNLVWTVTSFFEENLK